MGIHNPGDAPDRLVGARAARAGSIEIHQAAQTGGVMSIVPVDSVEIPAEGTAHLGPGGLHLMLFGLAPPLMEGESIPIVLIFESAGEIPIEVPVMKMMGHDLQQDHDGGHLHGTTGN